MRAKTVFVGVGSPHGDDQVGWHVAEQLESWAGPDIAVHRAAAPGELLDWLECASRLILCDACIAEAPTGTVLHWQWPNAIAEPICFVGSHDLPLSAVLEIAAQLELLPKYVTIWGVVISHAKPGRSLSPTLADAVPTIVERIAKEICNA